MILIKERLFAFYSCVQTIYHAVSAAYSWLVTPFSIPFFLFF